MAGKTTREVRGLSIPLEGLSLILPDSIIVQIVTGADIIPLEDSPDWLLGTIVWQKRSIPTLSFEIAANHQYSGKENPRVLVLKSINNIEKMPFYGLPLYDIPKPARVNEENISSVDNAAQSPPVILNTVLLDGEPGNIPNLDVLEEMLMSQYDLFAEEESAA